MTDPDVQYLRDLAKGYANSFVDGWQEEHRRLNAIADRLDRHIQDDAAKKEAWQDDRRRRAFDTLPDDFELG